jgi:hypothetical protein
MISRNRRRMMRSEELVRRLSGAIRALLHHRDRRLVDL